MAIDCRVFLSHWEQTMILEPPPPQCCRTSPRAFAPPPPLLSPCLKSPKHDSGSGPSVGLTRPPPEPDPIPVCQTLVRDDATGAEKDDRPAHVAAPVPPEFWRCHATLLPPQLPRPQRLGGPILPVKPNRRLPHQRATIPCREIP